MTTAAAASVLENNLDAEFIQSQHLIMQRIRREQRLNNLSPWEKYKTLLITFSSIVILLLFSIRKFGIKTVFTSVISVILMSRIVYSLVKKYNDYYNRHNNRWFRNRNNAINQILFQTGGINRNGMNGRRRIPQTTTRFFPFNRINRNHLNLMMRDNFTPEDYDQLLALDEELPSRHSLTKEQIETVPSFVVSTENNLNLDRLKELTQQQQQIDNNNVSSSSNENDNHEEEEEEEEEINQESNTTIRHRRSFSKKKQSVTKTHSLEWLKCSICLEYMVPGQKVRVTPCYHQFHAEECLDKWLMEKNNCPICKSQVL